MKDDSKTVDDVADHGSDPMTKQIYAFVNTYSAPDILGVLALCEDGTALAWHISSSMSWARHDIGIGSESKHELYRAHCPYGYDLIWIDDPADDARIKAAYKANQALAKDQTT